MTPAAVQRGSVAMVPELRRQRGVSRHLPARFALIALLAWAPACVGDFTDPERKFGPPVPADAPTHPVTIHQPATLGALDTAAVDVNGAPIGVGCATCHGPTPETSFAGSDGPPAGAHEHIQVAHGGLSCDACHDPADRARLRLADGSPRAFTEAMDLCGQCHGPQTRDYRRGSHGGMNGYWDLRRGPRIRNHCLDCHSPHAPALGPVQPVLAPADRYLRPAEGGHQ